MALMGRMMSDPLLISSLLKHAERHSGETEIRQQAGRGRPASQQLARGRAPFAPGRAGVRAAGA